MGKQLRSRGVQKRRAREREELETEPRLASPETLARRLVSRGICSPQILDKISGRFQEGQAMNNENAFAALFGTDKPTEPAEPSTAPQAPVRRPDDLTQRLFGSTDPNTEQGA